MTPAQSIDLMIVGAQKAGTTSLYNYLGQHPSVVVHRQPEMSYFVNDSEFALGESHAWKKYFGALEFEGKKIIAKHVLLMYSQSSMQRLLRHNSHIDLVISLRNPIDRAYSAYWYARRKAWETLDSFEDAIQSEQARLTTGWYQWRRNTYLSGGHYADHLEEMLRLIEMDKIHVLTVEDLTRDAVGICSRLFESLGIDNNFEPLTTVLHNPVASARSSLLASAISQVAESRHPVRNALRRIIPTSWSAHVRHKLEQWNEVPFEPPPMDAMTRSRLVHYFRPYNHRLGELLHRDFDHWNA